MLQGSESQLENSTLFCVPAIVAFTINIPYCENAGIMNPNPGRSKGSPVGSEKGQLRLD